MLDDNSLTLSVKKYSDLARKPILIKKRTNEIMKLKYDGSFLDPTERQIAIVTKTANSSM